MTSHPSHVEVNLDEYTEKQLAALEEFRKRVSHKVPIEWNCNLELLRWLRARNFSVNKAEDMLLKSLAWRKEWQMDTILDWNPPEVLKKYYGYGFSGYDKEGAPVLVLLYGNCDVRGLLHCCTKQDFLRYEVQMLEKCMDNMRTKSAELKLPIRNEIFLVDMDNFSFVDFTWKPALEIIIQLTQIFEANYPEILKTCYLVNAPKIFTAAFALIKPFMHEVTQNKMKIFGKTGWQELVLDQIPADQLPAHWGGTMVDEDGNPRCPSKICLGGKVPESFYLKSREMELQGVLDEQYKSLVVPTRAKKVIEFEVKQKGTELSWEVQLDDYDVGFGVSRKMPSGGEEMIHPSRKIKSRIIPETGSLTCPDPGLYKIIFDNEYSYLHSKKIYYKIQLQSPDCSTKL